MAKIRPDQLLVQRGLVESRERGQRLIMAGEVLVNEQVADKPGQPVAAEAVLRIKAPLPYVSRQLARMWALRPAVLPRVCHRCGIRPAGLETA